MSRYEVIEERVTGTRTVQGTDHQVVDQLVRDQRQGRPVWVVVRSLCNGVPYAATEFTRKKDALLAWG